MKLFKKLMIIHLFAILFFFYSEGAFSRDIPIPPSGPKEFTVFKVELKEFGMDGTGEHLLMRKNSDYRNDKYADEGEKEIKDPVWIYDRLKNDPVCFTRGSAPELVKVKLATEPYLSKKVSAKLRVTFSSPAAPNELIFEKNIILNGSEWILKKDEVIAINAINSFDDFVGRIAYDHKWELSLDGGSAWTTFFDTHTPGNVDKSLDVLLTYATPQGSIVTAKRMYGATSNAGGISTLRSIAGNIHHNLATSNPPHEDSRLPSVDEGQEWELLDGKKYGRCNDQAKLMELALEILGIPENKVETKLVRASKDSLNCLDFESRDCSIHGEEYLCLDFAQGLLYTINAYEGVCVVEGHYYAVVPELDATDACEILRLLKVDMQIYSFYGGSHIGVDPCQYYPHLECCKTNSCIPWYHPCNQPGSIVDLP